jgi:hypothetical protein
VVNGQLTTDIPTEDSAGTTTIQALEAGLAALWLMLPAVQYLGAVRRTQASVQREIALDTLARLDLMPWYILLLGLTQPYGAISMLGSRRVMSGAAESRK